MAENFRNENSDNDEDDDYELTPPILGFFLSEEKGVRQSHKWNVNLYCELDCVLGVGRMGAHELTWQS